MYLNKRDDETDVFLKAINIPERASIVCYGAIDPDGSRYLLGDHDGTLYLLVILHDGKKVKELKIERLGETSIPSTLSYLDNGVVFVGKRVWRLRNSSSCTRKSRTSIKMATRRTCKS